MCNLARTSTWQRVDSWFMMLIVCIIFVFVYLFIVLVTRILSNHRKSKTSKEKTQIERTGIGGCPWSSLSRIVQYMLLDTTACCVIQYDLPTIQLLLLKDIICVPFIWIRIISFAFLLFFYFNFNFFSNFYHLKGFMARFL